MNTYVAPGSHGLLRPLQPWLDDDTVTDIFINSPGFVFVGNHNRMRRFNVSAMTEHYLSSLFQMLANDNHKTLTEQHPMMAGNLPDGSRIQLVIPPISQYPVAAIRRHRKLHLQVKDYLPTKCELNHNTHPTQSDKSHQQLIALYKQQQWQSFLSTAVFAKKNILVIGGTGTGKTTLLQTLLKEIPIIERIVLLEDARELQLPHENQLRLLTRSSSRGMPAITLQQLVQCSLRLRPDRIIIGEVRGKEILDFLGAAITGHPGSMTSLHAESVDAAFTRMIQLYKQNNVPAMSTEEIRAEIEQVIDVIVTLVKTPTGPTIQQIFYQGALNA